MDDRSLSELDVVGLSSLPGHYVVSELGPLAVLLAFLLSLRSVYWGTRTLCHAHPRSIVLPRLWVDVSGWIAVLVLAIVPPSHLMNEMRRDVFREDMKLLRAVYVQGEILEQAGVRVGLTVGLVVLAIGITGAYRACSRGEPWKHRLLAVAVVEAFGVLPVSFAMGALGRTLLVRRDLEVDAARAEEMLQSTAGYFTFALSSAVIALLGAALVWWIGDVRRKDRPPPARISTASAALIAFACLAGAGLFYWLTEPMALEATTRMPSGFYVPYDHGDGGPGSPFAYGRGPDALDDACVVRVLNDRYLVNESTAELSELTDYCRDPSPTIVVSVDANEPAGRVRELLVALRPRWTQVDFAFTETMTKYHPVFGPIELRHDSAIRVFLKDRPHAAHVSFKDFYTYQFGTGVHRFDELAFRLTQTRASGYEVVLQL